jgi:2-polyprenyl-3-methyl-5-hydroxy-6-metoxy-1,4-benzoquinol methylase
MNNTIKKEEMVNNSNQPQNQKPFDVVLLIEIVYNVLKLRNFVLRIKVLIEKNLNIYIRDCEIITL